MIVTDLSNSFNPCPKNGEIKKTVQSENKLTKTDFCIMPKSTKYSTTRTKKYNERHEVFFSRAYRTKSIKDGLIVFLTEEGHRGTKGAHGKNGDRFNRFLKRTAQKAWIDYYGKTKEEFIQRYGKANT